MDVTWPASPPYVVGSILNWLFFLLTVLLLAWNREAEFLPAAAEWGVVFILAGSVAAQFAVAYRLIARQDEYIRGITAKRCIAATGLAITLTVLWGLAEQFLSAPDLPMWFVYPLFWGALGMVTPFIRDSRP